MVNIIISGIALFILVSGCHGELPSMEFEKHFSHLSQIRHPNFKNGIPRQEAREYIKERFKWYGITNIETQTFNTTITQVGPESTREVEGENIIGIMEGSDKSGPIIVVGADYDTPRKGDPFRNNGAGVACMLETIHLFQDRVRWAWYHLNYTVIFVAFDLNTQEYLGPSEGYPGSYIFASEWLNHYLRNGTREFLGAIILDSVTTYYTANNSQNLPPGFDLVFPEANDDIEARGMKGDYLGFLYSNYSNENPIVEAFVDNYRKEKKQYKFRLQEMKIHGNLISVEVRDTLDTFNHQAHFSFWMSPNNTLPAFLLFDTEQYREEPSPYDCPEEDGCSVDQFLTKDRVQFLTKTTNTVLNTLLQLQTTKKDVTDSSAYHGGSIILLLMAMIVYLIHTRNLFV